jgi:alginate O-acetyltransferase complex protein AlgI
MVFSSILFLFVFLPVVLGLYYLCPRRGRNLLLVLVSLVFYGWGEPVYIVLMLFTLLWDYTCARLIEKYREDKRKAKLFILASVAENLCVLGFFKYSGFFLQNLSLLPGLHNLPILNLALPLGISFYTFHTMSYTIDVYRGQSAVQRNIIDFAAYVLFFPQLVAGPIARYHIMADQFQGRRENVTQFASGVRLFCIGLAKKVLLANSFGLLWDSVNGLAPSSLSVVSAWLGVAAFSLQIYFDFSGYSDMAVGLGRMFGFELLKNFDYPYISRSITEFWRRWHISLSTWFREYVYIPLGGNRKGVPRMYLNLLVVWALTGFWHGANWNFLLWGGYFAVILIAEKAFLQKRLEKAPKWAGRLYALVLIGFGWVLFSFTDLGRCVSFAGAMVGFAGSFIDSRAVYLLLSWLPLLAVGALAATPLPARLFHKLGDSRASVLMQWAEPALCLLAMVLCTAYLVDASYNPFLYFRF